MALRVGVQRGLQAKVDGCLYTVRRLTHAFALPPSFCNSIEPISSPPLTLPEDDTDFSCEFPGLAPGGGTIDLMAVPKRKESEKVERKSGLVVVTPALENSGAGKLIKLAYAIEREWHQSLSVSEEPKQPKMVSRHKRGIRNGPKALKPIPVIVRCKCCGRVKLPHFYCCSGRKEDPGERSDAAN